MRKKIDNAILLCVLCNAVLFALRVWGDLGWDQLRVVVGFFFVGLIAVLSDETPRKGTP